MEQFVELNTDGLEGPQVGNDLFQNRSALSQTLQQTANAEVTVFVQAYNRLDKTKRCVESILQNTQGIDYELLLLDNGSEDGTLDFFRTIPYEKKRIIHITKNIGGVYAQFAYGLNDIGQFLVSVSNDLILTPHWLENLLICIKSDPKIGMVNPVSSNTSNLQEVDISYGSYQEMQRKAERFNRSDPRKWEDRQRLITLGTLMRKELLLALGWPMADLGFFHDFADDDLSFSVRRLGYRTVLAGDTWICHDHDIWHGEGKDPVQFHQSLKIGRANFIEKYFGVDAWSDANNYYIPYLEHFPAPDRADGKQILGIDVRCGTPILDIKNWLRKAGIFHADLSAFTQDPKYWLDLKTICKGPVICDREEFLLDSFIQESFDYVLVDRPLNRYHEPVKILRDMFALCKKGGYLICKLLNAYSFREYLNQLGQREVYNPQVSYNISLEQFQSLLSRSGKICFMMNLNANLDKENQRILSTLLPTELSDQAKSAALQRLLCEEYLFVVKKEGGIGGQK